MPVVLRDYQKDAVDAIYEYWEQDKGSNPLVVAPTGSGKSIMIADFCHRVCTDDRSVKIMCVTDSMELIAQNEKQMRAYWPEASTGVYSAGLGRRQTQAQITFAGIQSIYNKAYNFDKLDIILVDEAHMIPRKEQTRYGAFLKDAKKVNPNVVVVGFTATPYRLDSGMLHEGEEAMFDGIAYVCEMKRLIKEGYLVPVVSKGGVAKIDLTHVHLQAGDYKPNELAHAADDPQLIKLAVEEIVKYGEERKAWLVFCSGVDHAEHVAKEIRSHGVECEVVTGETPTEERTRIVNKFRSGKLKCMVNVAVFTKGFDAPVCDLIAMLTSTKSTGKYVQIVGRGMRPYPDKEDCLLLDYGQNVITHGPIDEVDPVKKKNVFLMEKKAPPMKECVNCRVILHARSMVCPACGYEFPVSAPHGTEAFAGAVLAGQQQPFFVDVSGIWVARHKKMGGTDSVRVEFIDANNKDKAYPLWLPLDHTGYASEKAMGIVRRFGGKATTVDEALKEWPSWRKVLKIRVRPEKKFLRVDGFVFAKNQSVQQGLVDDLG